MEPIDCPLGERYSCIEERSGVPSVHQEPKAVADASEEIADLARCVCYAYGRGRRPLVLIGAGVSSAARIPLMDDLLQHLCGLIEPRKGELRETYSLLEGAKQSRARSSLALLFSALQEAPPAARRVREVWSRFCLDLVNGSIPVGTAHAIPSINEHATAQASSLFARAPTRAHEWVAKMCLDFGAQCVSLNFDGLTRKAISNELAKRKPSERCVVLDSASKIISFFGREPSASPLLRGVLKLRGDIFYASCETSGCPLQSRETPVYELSAQPESDNRSADMLLACPECAEERNLQISFPGYHLKERESEEILAAVNTFVVPSVSMIIILGLSGEWDPALVEFAFTAAQTQDVPVVDVRLKPGDGQSHYIYDVWRTRYPTLRYLPLYGKADEFVDAVTRCVDKIGAGDVASDGPAPSLDMIGVEQDHIWRQERAEDRNNLAGHISKLGEVDTLRFYSQLGLKTLWWSGPTNVGRHDRYHHSLGAMRVADQWWGRLFAARLNPVERELLLVSMLLHDYGHLPFSHLFEDIFEELHWLPAEPSSSAWHEVLTKRKIRELFESAANRRFKEYLEKLGYGVEDIVFLIEGHAGKPYLDAIVNSAIDADKIDYIFRDISFLQFGSSLPPNPKTWLDDFLSDQDLSPEGFIRLNGRSALTARELLNTRHRLYSEFYLAPELRMMERMTSFILVCYLAHRISPALAEKLRNDNAVVDRDHGPIKVNLASNSILEVYRDVLARGDEGTELREGLLVSELVGEILADHFLNPVAAESLKCIGDLLKDFADSSNRVSQSPGAKVRQLYRKLHVAGPYYADEPHEHAIREIVRELTLLHHGRVLFDVVKSPKYLATPPARDMGGPVKNSKRVFGETFLVPDIDPSAWTVKSRARVPLHAVDFGTFLRRPLQIIVFSPFGESPEGRHVHQQFRRRCSRANILLNERLAVPGSQT